MQKIFWLYQLIDNVVLNIWNESENVWRIRVERKKRWPLQLFLPLSPIIIRCHNCHPLSSRRFDHLCSCSSFIPLTSPANLLIMSRGILRSTWVAWSKKCPQWKRRRRPNLSCSEWAQNGALAHWHIGITWHSSCCCEAWSTFFSSALFPFSMRFSTRFLTRLLAFGGYGLPQFSSILFNHNMCTPEVAGFPHSTFPPGLESSP